MFVGEWGEGDGREPSALQPVHSGGVNSYCLFCCNVGTILWVRGGKGEEGREGGKKEGEVKQQIQSKVPQYMGDLQEMVVPPSP